MTSLTRCKPKKKTTHIFLLEKGGKRHSKSLQRACRLESRVAPRAAPYRGDAATVSLQSASPRVQPAPLPLRLRCHRRRRLRWLRARNRSRGRARAHGPRAPGGQEARHHWGTARRSSPPGSWVSAPQARAGGAQGAVVGPGWERHRDIPGCLRHWARLWRGMRRHRDQASPGMGPYFPERLS